MKNSLSVLFLVCVAVVLTFGVHTSFAVPGAASEENTVITSDKAVFDYGRSIALFSGNVVVVDPRVTIRCDKLQVEFTEENAVKRVLAKENVRIEQEDKLGTCDQAIYTAASGAIVMTGRAKLRRGRDVASSREIQIFVNSEKVISEERTKLVIFPETSQKAQVRRQGR